ncbi:pre-mRNA-splicing factor Slu7-like protein [Coemansia mojavensis]|nr:pre-mRNA-splicing factor Slu7-like protein [Coemansia mojavensis]
MSNSYGGRLSREDYKKQKELEAARMAGTAPPEVDEEGNEINPHIPQFMSQAPWYINTGKPSLQHQRKQPRPKSRPASTLPLRKKGCENCGSSSHTAKDCLERPRKKPTRPVKSSEQTANKAEEELSYDAKRDEWSGYDAREHRKLLEEWELIEEARKKRKAEALDQKKAEAQKQKTEATRIEDQLGSSDEGESDDDSVQKSRNLRIREDTAKYLRNLDPDSAYYDPKTRSMRENPYNKPASQLAYAGDNFIRYSGEAQQVLQRQVFAWEASERGNSAAHVQANPTQTALLYNEFKRRKSEAKSGRQQKLLAEYGGEEHLQAPPPELLQQSEQYVEYSRTGQLVSGNAAAQPKRYREDIYPLNHSSVFGSWWDDGKWGYRCCKQTMRNSYCTKLKK